jgi:hypothetical protein
MVLNRGGNVMAGVFKILKQSKKDARLFGGLAKQTFGKGAHSTIPSIPKKTMKRAIKAGTAVKRKKR